MFGPELVLTRKGMVVVGRYLEIVRWLYTVCVRSAYGSVGGVPGPILFVGVVFLLTLGVLGASVFYGVFYAFTGYVLVSREIFPLRKG